MIIGYARTSTIDQIAGLEAQLRELQAAGCEKIFKEQASSVEVRLQFEAAIEFIREGDALVVTKLDRLARSVSDLMTIIKALESKKAGFWIIHAVFEHKNFPCRTQTKYSIRPSRND